MKKLLGYIFTPLFYFFFYLSLVVFHPIQWVCYRFFGYQAHKTSVDILNFCITKCFIFLGSSTTFINQQDLPLNHPIIFIANHQSMYDIPPLVWYLRKYHFKFISKVELTKGIPSISFNLKYGGGANIDRKDSKQAISEIIKLGRRMKEFNWSAMIFPEGTRAKDGQVKTFQIGGIASLLKGAPNALLVPVAIENSWRTVQYGSYPLSCGEKIRMTVLAPIPTAGLNAEELTKMAENAIRKALNQEIKV
jgi:1-acyl-sn-glycerol-3-phosphate acyltransferase